MNSLKNILFYSLLLFLSNTKTIYGQWKYENYKAPNQDIIIEYSVTYENTLSKTQKKSSSYISEIITIINKDKLIEKRFYKPGFYKDFSLIDYKKSKAYNCNLKYKKGIYSDFKEPTKEGTLQEGQGKEIINKTCEKYISTVNGRPVELYTTKEFGLRYVKDFNVQGLLMEYTMYNEYLGYYTVKANKITLVNLPESTYSLKGYSIMSEEKQKDYVEKAKLKREKLLKEKMGKKSPNFYARSMNGKKIAENNKILVLNFWFKNCPPCRKEIPKLNQLKQQYADNPNIEFVAIGLDDQNSILTFLETNPISYDIVDSGRSLAKKFSITSYPTNIIIDKEGITQFFEIGYKKDIKVIMTNKIDELLDN